MTLKLDKARENALTVAIADELGRATVDHDCYVSLRRSDELDGGDLLPTDSMEKVYRYCGDGGLRAFVTNEVNTTLRNEYEFKADSSKKPLRNYEAFSDQLAAAKRIVSRLKSLPYRYRVTVQLPAEISTPLLPYVAAVKLSENAAVCLGNRLPTNFETESSNERLDRELFSDFFGDSLNTSREIRDDMLYFTCTDVGYTFRSAAAPVISQFQDRLRALFGAVTALGFFDTAWGFPSEKKPFVIVHAEGDDRQIVETQEIEDDLWQRRYLRSTRKFVDGSDDPALAIRTVFDRAAIILGSDESARRLFTASIWLYRAKQSTNPLDSLLQSTIAIETLLGDKETADLVGLSKLLGNRCAYLLGVSRSTRQEIMAEFTEIYGMRSAIVHTGKHKVDRRDRDIAAKCLNLCSRVIARELELHHGSAMHDRL
jgi:hypothetical protein